MQIARILSLALLSGAAFVVGTTAVHAQDAGADGLVQIDAALHITPPTGGDAPAIQALIDEALAKQAAGDVEGCAASVAKVKQILQIQ